MEDAALAALRLLPVTRPQNRRKRMERYRFRAEVLRDIAEEVWGIDTKLTLRGLARWYDNMADMLEHPC